MAKKILKEVIGLSDIEVQTYFTLLNLGPQPASIIASKVNAPRPSIYPVLDRLLKKGLITYCLRRKVRFFSSISLDKLEMKLQEKEMMYNTKAELIKKNRGKLKDYFQIYKSDRPNLKGKSKVQSYIGIEGIKTLWSSLMSQKGTLMLYGWPSSTRENDETWVNKINKSSESKKCQILIPRSFRKRGLGKRLKESDNLEYKFVSDNYSVDTGECLSCIAGNQSAYIAYQDDLMYGVLADDIRLSGQLKRVFKLISRF